MDDNNQPKKPIFLYVVIIVLVIALAGLGALSFSSLSVTWLPFRKKFRRSLIL